MSQPQAFNFYLRKKNGANYDYYSVNSSGSIITTTSATPINHINFAPKGWKELAYTDKRGFEYKGIFRAISTPLEFVNDGAKILKSIFLVSGVQSKLELFIQKFNPEIGVYDYQTWYIGDLDFTQSKVDESYFVVKVVEGGFLAKLQSRENTNYEIELTNNPLVKWIHFSGIYLQFRQVWVCASLEVLGNNLNTKVPTLSPLTGEGYNQIWGIYQQDLTGSSIDLFSNISGATESITLKYDYNYGILIPPSASNPAYLELSYEIIDITTGVTATTIIAYLSPTLQAINSTVTYLGSVTNTFNVPANHKVLTFVKMKVSAGVYLTPSSYTATQLNSKLTLTSDIRTKEGYVPALRPYDVFNSLVDQLSDSETTSVSTLLSTTYKDCWITCGDALRNLDNAKLNLSFKDFYKSIESILGASLTYNKSTAVATIEGISNVFQNTEMLDLGTQVNDVEYKPLLEKLYSKINVGYRDNTYDEVNGKDEFNTDIEFLSPLEKITQNEDYKSFIRTDVYGIEQIRLNLSEKKVTDSKTDNDVFMIHIDDKISGTIPANYQGFGANYYDVFIDPSLTISNIYGASTMYNFLFSPMRCYLRNGAWHHSLLYGNDSSVIKFIKSTKSNQLGTYLVTNDGVTTISECVDIAISSLPDIIFKPFIFDIETYTLDDITSAMQTNPYGYITFTWKGNIYKGYVLSFERDAKIKSKTKLSLLCTPSTDLTNLI